MRIIQSFVATLVPGVLVLGIAVLTAVSVSAQERDDRPWYLEAHGSVAFTQSADLRAPGIPVPNVGNVDVLGKTTFHTGWGGGVAAGRAFDDFRVEAEVSWRRVGIDHIENIRSEPATAASTQFAQRLARSIDITGRLDHLTGMVNAYWDVPTGTRFRPYIGGGLGTVHAVMHKNARRLTRPSAEDLARLSPEARQSLEDQGGTPVVDDKDQDRWGFAWQAAAGVGFDLTDFLAVRAGYRFLHVPNLDFSLFEGQRTSTSSPVTITAKPVHSIDFGLRVRF